MDTDKPQAASETADSAQADETPPQRLVIRVKIIREESSQAIASRPLDKRALAMAIGISVIVALTLVWIVVSVFSGDVESSSTASVASNVASHKVASQSLSPVPAPTEAAVAVTPELVAPQVEEQADVPPSAINEVIPNVPQSALQTIRGTVRVAIRVVIGQDGTVFAASSEIPGPSRYFERIALQAAKEWVFTPADGQDDREMLVRFYFKRDGVTAGAEPFAVVEPVVSDGPSPPRG